MNKLISHPQEKSYSEKPLKVHLHNVARFMTDEIEKANLDLSVIPKSELKRLAMLTGLFHDIGKATTFFQAYIREPDKKSGQLKNHGLLSAILAFQYLINQGYDQFWSYNIYQIIKAHHNNLSAFSKFESFNSTILTRQLDDITDNSLSELEKIYSDFNIEVSFITGINLQKLLRQIKTLGLILKKHQPNIEKESIEEFFLINYIFSLLVDYDKHDAARLKDDYFIDNLETDFISIDKYLDHKRQKQPEKFSSKKPINRIRNQFLDDISRNESISSENHFYTLTAPTGIGKTFGCLKFAEKLQKSLDHNYRLVYALPFTSIIDQNFAEFENIYRIEKQDEYNRRPNRYLLKHHYLASKRIKNRVEREEYSFKDYLDDKLLVESWQSAFIVTTFVQLFHSIIGNRNRLLKKFHNIVNSIVILDEIQNVDPDYYELIRKTFQVLGERFNIYFLLMTATQPRIFDLDNNSAIELVDKEKYMSHGLFDRVRLTFKQDEMELQDFTEEFINEFDGRNCLIVLNTRKDVSQFYQNIQSLYPDYQKYCLTTNLIPKHRREKIREIEQKLDKGEKIIVVSTQLIEAGVDLSFEQVYRDIGPLDSVIQVAGRCNRHTEYGPGNGKMKLVNIGSAKKIYKSSLIDQTIESLEEKGTINSSQFHNISKRYFKALNFEYESDRLIKSIKELNYNGNRNSNSTPISNFKLIKEIPQTTIFILLDDDAENKMNTLLKNKDLISEVQDEDREQILVDIQELKKDLREYAISLRKDELQPYRDIIYPDLQENSYYKYVGKEDAWQYLYDREKGFLWEPKETISQTEVF